MPDKRVTAEEARIKLEQVKIWASGLSFGTVVEGMETAIAYIDQTTEADPRDDPKVQERAGRFSDALMSGATIDEAITEAEQGDEDVELALKEISDLLSFNSDSPGHVVEHWNAQVGVIRSRIATLERELEQMTGNRDYYVNAMNAVTAERDALRKEKPPTD